MAIITDVPLIDWLTLTTFNLERFRALRDQIIDDLMDRSDGRLTTKKVQQYEGVEMAGVFMGVGEQGGLKHCMMRVSGQRAQMVESTYDLGWMRATRVDCQVTIKKPDDYNPLEMFHELDRGEWNGRKRKLEVFTDGHKTGTIYIGSRKASNWFARLYVKGRNNEFLRFEIEMKRGAVKSWWAERYSIDGQKSATVGGPIRRMIDLLPRHPVMYEFSTHCRNVWEPVADIGETTMLGRANWFLSLRDTISRLLNDHDYGATIADMLIELLEDSGHL